MEAEKQQEIKKKPARRPHHGRAVRGVIDLLNITQGGLGDMLGLSQKQISTLISQETIKPERLQEIAEKLEVPVALLENFVPSDVLKMLIQQHNTFTNSDIKDSATINEANDQENNYSSDPTVIAAFERIIKDNTLKMEALIRENAQKEIENKELRKRLGEN